MADNFFQSKTLQWIITAVAGFVILSLVFSLGVFVGFKRADFSFRWADQYHHNFGGPNGGFFSDFLGNDFTNSNGVFGQIIKIDGQTLTVKGADNVEKNILVNNKTSIVLQRKNMKLSELDVDDNIVVIGNPNNNGQIEAKLIRVMPSLSKISNTTNVPQQPNNETPETSTSQTLPQNHEAPNMPPLSANPTQP